jgi:hypothetical protein
LLLFPPELENFVFLFHVRRIGVVLYYSIVSLAGLEKHIYLGVEHNSAYGGGRSFDAEASCMHV